MPKTTSPVIDIDALLVANVKRLPGGKCTVGSFYATIDPAVVAKIEQAMANMDRYSAVGLVAILEGCGYTGGRSPVERHRRKGCACPK